MREYVGALRAIWRCWQEGEPLDFAGRHYRFQRMQPFFHPGPIAPGAPRIALGAVGPAMTRLAGEVADALVTHPTQACPPVLRARVLPALAAGERRAGRVAGACAVVAGGFVATGADAAHVRSEREHVREYLAFLYSTPQYAGALEVLGVPEVGRELHALSRAGRWSEMPARIGDALLDALVPAAPYAEIAAVLRERFGALCSALTFPVPADAGQDHAARAAIEALRA
jgi:probable F420-dependent oxidoreductase